MTGLRNLSSLAALVLAAAGPVRAQTTPVLVLEVQRPSFKEDVSAFLITPGLRLPGGGGVELVAELPVAVAGAEGISTRVRMGNSYFGGRIAASPAVTVDLGLRLPLATEGGYDDYLPLAAGLVADFERFEAYVPKLLAVRLGVMERHVTRAGVLSELRLAGNLMKSTEGGGDAELFMDYGAALGVVGTKVEAAAGIGGRLVVTEEGSFGERSIHQFTFRASFGASRLRPVLTLRFPLDEDLSDDLKFVLGLGVSVPLR